MDTSVLLVEWQEEECTKPNVVGLSAADRKIREKSCVIVWLVGGVSPSIKFFVLFFHLVFGFSKSPLPVSLPFWLRCFKNWQYWRF